MRPDEHIASLVPVRAFADDQFLFGATKQGVVKKTQLSEFGNPRSSGIRAINIDKGDELIDVQVTDGSNDIVLATRHGMSIRFHESDVRGMGRSATGVWGIALDKKDQGIDMGVVRRQSTLLAVTSKGMGKRSELDEYRVQRRGGRGIITLKRNEKTGDVVALKEVLPDDELMMITKKGIIIRVPVEGIRISGRNTQGVKVMNLIAGDLVVDVARVVNEDDDENSGGAVRSRAQLMGVVAVITMHETAPGISVGGGNRGGCYRILAGRASEARRVKGREIAGREGAAGVAPFDRPGIVAGQGTVGL